MWGINKRKENKINKYVYNGASREVLPEEEKEREKSKSRLKKDKLKEIYIDGRSVCEK